MKESNQSNLPLRSGEMQGEDTAKFFNTIGLIGEDLAKARKQVHTQDSKILDFLKANQKLCFTKYEIKIALVNLGKIGANTPESSISRALSQLRDKGQVLKLSGKREGGLGKPNHLWRAKPEPMKVGIQTDLFYD